MIKMLRATAFALVAQAFTTAAVRAASHAIVHSYTERSEQEILDALDFTPLYDWQDEV